MITHNFILHEEQRPVCIPCYSFTTEHPLVDIIDIRSTFYTGDSVNQLFPNVAGGGILCGFSCCFFIFFVVGEFSLYYKISTCGVLLLYSFSFLYNFISFSTHYC